MKDKIFQAMNPNTPVDILVELSKDDNYLVRCNIANNLNTPINIFYKLSKDDNYTVRCGYVVYVWL